MAVNLDPKTGCFVWTDPQTGISHYFDYRKGAWKFLFPGSSEDWRWSASGGGKHLAAPLRSPPDAPAPSPPVFPGAAHAAAQDPASNEKAPEEPDEVKRVAAEIEELKNRFESFEARVPTSEKLPEIGIELYGLSRKLDELRASLGDTRQIVELVMSLRDLTGEYQDLKALRERLDRVSDKGDATYDLLIKIGKGAEGGLKNLDARVKELEDRPAESATNPQTPSSSLRGDAGPKENAMPQTENRTETTSNSQASQPPRGDAGQKEKTMRFYESPKFQLGGVAVLALLVVGAFLPGILHSVWNSMWNSEPQKITTAVGTGDNGLPVISETHEQRDRRFAEIAGATFDQRIKPVNNDLEKLQAKTDKLENGVSETKNAVGALDGRFSGFQNTMDDIKKLLKEKQEKDAVAANDAIEAKRLALVKAQCLPGAEKDMNLKADLPDDLFQSALKVCRAEKEEKMRQAQTPVGSAPQTQAQVPYASSDAGDPPTASTGDADDPSSQPQDAYASAGAGDDSSVAPSGGDDLTGSYDPRTASAMSAHVAQASYVGPGGPGPGFGPGGPGFGPSGRGPRGGAVRCPPGMRMTPIGLCGITVMADQRIKDRYNVPPQVAHCRPGDVRTFKQPLPGGGMRVVHQTCRR